MAVQPVLTRTAPPSPSRSAQQPQALRDGHQIDPRSPLAQLDRRIRRFHLPKIRPGPLPVLPRSCASLPGPDTSRVRAPLLGTGKLLLPAFVLLFNFIFVWERFRILSFSSLASPAGAANFTTSPAHGPLSRLATIPRRLAAARSALPRPGTALRPSL